MGMKVTLIGLTHPLRGGIAHYCTVLAQELINRHQLQFLSFKRLYPRLLFPGKTQYDHSQYILSAPNRPLLDPLNPLSWIRSFLHIKDFRPHQLLFQWWHPITSLTYWSIGLLCKRVIPSTHLVFLCHNVFPHEPFPMSKTLVKMTLKMADRLIVHAASDEKLLRRLFPFKPIFQTSHPLYLIFNDQELERSTAKRRLLLEPEEKMVLFFGMVRRYKGLRYLIEAMPQVLREVDCRFFIVGEFYEDIEPYLTLIRERGLQRHTRIIPQYIPNEEVKYYFCASDLVILPYVSATQSGIIQIAYAFDRPVIATKVGGLSDLVEDGATGYLVRARDPTALARAIILFFKANKGEEFQNNIRRSKERFSWRHLIKLIEEID